MSAPEAARRPLESLLVATDFSKGAGLALDRALLLPLARGVRIHLVHALPADMPARLRAVAETEARARLEGLVSQARQRQAKVEVELTSGLLRGEPFVEIIRSARRIDADLVVLGRHGRRPILDMLIGTTAERVVRKGDVPILVVNTRPAHPYRQPLIATDLEDTSRRTVDLALRVLGPDAGAVDVVHAFHVPFEGFVTPSQSARKKSDWRRSFQESSTKGLERFLAPYRDRGVRWRTFIREGDRRSVVLALAARRKADLIAVGTHGRSGLAHALVGSVAEWIIGAATCDVLVARPVRFSFELP